MRDFNFQSIHHSRERTYTPNTKKNTQPVTNLLPFLKYFKGDEDLARMHCERRNINLSEDYYLDPEETNKTIPVRLKELIDKPDPKFDPDI